MASMKEWVTEAISSTGWVWGPLVAYYAPWGLSSMYFNKHLRRYARRLVPFLDPFVSIDIANTRGEESGQSSNNAYKEVEAYLTKVCMGDAHAFCAEGTVEVEGSSGFLLSLREGQEVTDDFRAVTVWWLLTTTKSTTDRQDTSCFRLMFPQKHRALILDEYLPHVRQTGREDLLVTIDIVDQKNSIHPMHNGDLKLNEAFEEVKAYLNSACSRDALDLNAHGTVKGDSFLFSLRKGEEVADSFSGVTLRWLSLKIATDFESTTTTCYRLVFPQQHRALILDEYLPHVRREGRIIMIGKRGKKLYSNRRSISDTSSSWSHIDFEHPTTFDTFAMHPNKKRKIMEDLDNFRRSKDYYRRIGKPWKRGYLLYGPPGTGKSTMIAAMANYLNYDIYDMELTSVWNNSDLRSLLVRIPGMSIIVFEDIDCCFNVVTSQRSNQEGRSTLSRYYNDQQDDDDKSKVTLSGLLNFIDSVWSAQTSERIIVFTTNFPDKLDQALIRSGRMDMHIEMSYCCFEAFQTLAMNYLGVGEHPLFQRVEELLQVVEITPADVAECFLRSQTDIAGSGGGVETCIGHLIDELEKKAAEPKKRRRLVPFITIDIVNNKPSTGGEESGQSSNNAYKEVETYLIKVCMRDANSFCAAGTVEGLLLSLREGQEVADDFRGVTVWWIKGTTGDGRDTSCFRLMFPQQHRAFILDEYLPHVRQIGRENMFVTVDIVEPDNHSINANHLKFSHAFDEVKAYLNSACSRDAHDLYADGTISGDSFLFSLREGGEVADSFSDVTLQWSSPKSTLYNCFRLMFPQQHRALILDKYLPHVRRQGRNLMIGKRGKRHYSNRKFSGDPFSHTISSWSHIDFEHPTTFDTVAMHPNKKRKIMEDLDHFRGNKDYYRRIGKPWKRGYLLHGPPGTGKSTMIAAMANYLNYDIYDLDLTSVSNNSELRSLLVQIPGKSIIVFEDIDCCFDDVTSQRSNQEGRSTLSRYCNDNNGDKDKDKSKVTLSGLLNFIDGVWSAQTGERIIVFTTNFPDKLDEALIRSGRMDRHIEMSYCCFEAFKTLAKNYLDVEAHPLFQRVEELLKVVKITPADVAECFIRSQSQTDFAGSHRGVEASIGCLIDELEKKKAALNEHEKKAAQPEPKKRRRRRY